MIGQKTKKFYVVLAITLLLMLAFGFLPPFGQITPMGMRLLGIFIGCIFAWTMGELVWSSILGLLLAAWMGFGTVNGNYAAALGNSTIGLLFFSLVFCYGIERCGLLREVALCIVSSRFAQKGLWTLMAGFFVAAAVAGALATNALPPIIILWTLFYDIAKELGLKPYDKYVSIMLIGIAVVCYSGTATMPYAIMALIVRGVAASVDPTFVLSNAKYIFTNIVVNILFIPFLIFVLKAIVRPPIEQYQLANRPPHQIQLASKMKWMLFYLIMLLVLMIVPNAFPADTWVYRTFVSTLGNLGIFMLITCLMMVTKIFGDSLVDIEEGLKEGTQWSLILMVGCALTLSNFLTADGMGIVPSIVSLIAPIVAGRSAVTITVMFVVLALVMTNIINDAVTATVLYPIAAQFILDAGGSLSLFICLFVPAVIQGCFMPSGSVIGALMHGNSSWLRAKDVFKYVALMELALCLVLALVTFVGKLLGL